MIWVRSLPKEAVFHQIAQKTRLLKSFSPLFDVDSFRLFGADFQYAGIIFQTGLSLWCHGQGFTIVND